MSSLSYTRNSVIHTSQLEMLEKGDDGLYMQLG